MQKTQLMKTRAIVIGLSIVACTAGLTVWQVRGAQPALPLQAPPPAVPVVAAKAQVSNVPIVLTGIGSVVAYNVVQVHAQVTGTLERIGITEGQTVHPGSLIAQLDPRPYEAALQQAEANLVRDHANLANARANLGRYVPLLKQGFATPQQVADQAATVSEVEAAITSDKAAIFNARTQLSYTTITSPISGVTGILGVDVGNIIQPGSTTPIVTITQIQPISVVFTLPQRDLPAVQRAMAKGTLQVLAYGQDDRTELGRGTLLLVNNTISQSSGTVQLKATFSNANRTLWPGEFVNVHLVLTTRHDGITIPLTALQEGQGGVVRLRRRDGWHGAGTARRRR